MTPHEPRDERYSPPARRGLAVQIASTGKADSPVPRSCTSLPPGVGLSVPRVSLSNARWFFLAYGPAHEVHRGTDRFDFADPFFRVGRFGSLFDRGARLTDPVAFLSLLLYRGLRKSRYPAIRTLARLAEVLGDALGIDVEPLNAEEPDLEGWWSTLPAWKRRPLVPLLDAVRHVVDASPFQPEPLDIPCPILLERPDSLFGPRAFPAWVYLLEKLFPRAQFVVTLGDEARARFPRGLLTQELPVPEGEQERPRSRRPKPSPGAIALVDVDGTLPNLALMKLSSYFRMQGCKVVLSRRGERIAGVEAAWASCIFPSESSAARLVKLRRWYGDSLTAGGSGLDVSLRLPPEVEALPPDYSLYPELGDRAIGFLTRGCPFTCAFCVVPAKEGMPRLVSDLDALLQGRKKLVLLDDNILAHPRSVALLEEMAYRKIEVNFTQTLDLRLVTSRKAELLRKVRCANTKFTRRVYHFSLNDAEGLDEVRRKYDLLRFTARENVEFVCMYGYDTTLAQDVARFRFLRSLPGAYVFVQRYRPLPGGPAPQVRGFFGQNPDRQIRELVSICFTQNMKSMEIYYRWLSRQYALAFGRLNTDLVETIFRYNYRWRKGLYVSTLAGTRPAGEAAGEHA